MENTKQQMNIDLTQATDLECKECGNKVFTPTFVLKHLSALLSPNGKASFIPTQIFSCSKCHQVPDEFLSAFNS